MNDATRLTSTPLAKANAALRGGRHGVLAKLAFGSVSVHATRTLSTGGIDPGRHLAFLPADTLELDLSDPAQRRFGDYELLEAIGEGGMGVVYRARQISLEREVAVKLLSAGPWASRDFVERFQREAQNAARMQHPNIVAIHEVGAIEGLHFFSMRLIRGSSLAQLIRDGSRLTPQRAAALLRTIAEAVDYAHRLGVLHLDLKPGNVLLDERGEPHVADFGLARRLDQAMAADNEEISGTPSYMAPEQATRGAQKITTATDVWGLGAIGYELVTGEPPFRSDTAKATLKLVLESTLRSPRRNAPALPRDLEAVILKCLSREPEQRYPTARALADDLQRFVEGRPVRARPLNFFQRIGRAARREPRTAALVLLVLIAMLTGLLATTQQWRAAQGNAKAAASSATLANERLWQSRIDQAAIALRDGHSYDALPLLAANIAEREAQGLDAREDRVRFATTERSVPRLIDIVATDAQISGIAISPDGSAVAVATKDEKLRLFDSATGAQRWTATLTGMTHALPDSIGTTIELAWLNFSADGRYLIGRNRMGGPQFLLPIGVDQILFDVANGKVLVPPAERVPNFIDATYSADGGYALVRSRGAGAVLMRTSDWQALGTPTPQPHTRACMLANGGRYLASADSINLVYTTLNLQDARSLSVLHRYTYPKEQRLTTWVTSPDGEALIVGHLDGRIEYIDFATGKREDVRPSPMARIGALAFSPDGRWFGAVADSGDVLVWDAATRRAAAPPMRLGVQPGIHRDYLMIDATARMVLASSDKEIALWHLPIKSAPERLSGQFPNIDADWWWQFALDASHGLIATDGGGDGQLRLWRMQPMAPIGKRGSPLPSPELHVGDGRVVSVEDNRVTVVAASDGRALGPTLELAQMPTFADLTDGGDLVVAVGPSLAVYDTATWTLRAAPIALPNDPARIVLSPDSRHALLTFADYDNGHNRELAQTWDLTAGKPTAPPLAVEATSGVSFSADGKALVLWQGDAVRVADALTLQPRWPWFEASARLAAEEPNMHPKPGATPEVTAAKFSRDGSQVDVLFVSGDPGYGAAQGASVLWHVDANTGNELGHVLLSTSNGGENFAAMPDRRAYVVQRTDSGTLWWDDVHGTRTLAPFVDYEYSALALTPDATMFARAGAVAIGLTSTRSLQWLSPVMPASLPLASDMRSEYLTQLAFSADGSNVIGRSWHNLWLRWNAAPDLRPVDQLTHEALLLSPAPGAVRPQPLTRAERQALREQDTGATLLQPVESRVEAIAPRRPDTPWNLVDMSATQVAAAEDWPFEEVQGEIPELAPGLHRFLGVDYDVRAMIHLDFGGAESIDVRTKRASKGIDMPSLRRVEGIRPGIARFDALDVLVTARWVGRQRERRPYGYVELAYRDGGREHLTIFYQSDVVSDVVSADEGQSGHDSRRVAWRAANSGSPRTYATTQRIFAVRLVNPHPEREVASLALEAAYDSTPSIYAITLEPIPVLHATSPEHAKE